MTHFILKQEVNPFDVAIQFLNAKIPIEIDGTRHIIVRDSLDKLSTQEREYLFSLPDSMQKNTNYNFYQKQERTWLNSKKPLVSSNGFFNVKEYEVYFADLGEPFDRNEFGYSHYVLIAFTDGGRVFAFPMTSKYHEGDTVLPVRITPDNFDGVEDFYRDKVSYIMFDQGQPYSKCRLIYKCGIFKEGVIREKIDACVEAFKNKCFSHNIREYNLPVTYVSSIRDRMLKENENREEIKRDANNYMLNYEEKLSRILKNFGFFNVGDGMYLFDFIRLSKRMQTLEFDRVFDELMKGKRQKREDIKNKLLTQILKKFRYEGIDSESVLMEFTQLVNELSGGKY